MAGSMKKLYIELADTPSKRMEGLMFRKNMEQDDGMLFKFNRSDNYSFWMSNTYIPLDIAFLSDEGTIMQIDKMYPLSTKSITSKNKCKYVLEVNQGWFKNNGLKEGDKLGGIYFDQIRFSQALQNLNIPNQGTQQTQQQQMQVKPEVKLELGFKEKIKYAEERGFKLRILYISLNSHSVGPRIISTVPQEGNKYPFFTGDYGEYFKAYDESPTINGPNYEVKGGCIKSYYLRGIQKLDILDKKGNIVNMMKGVSIQDVVKVDRAKTKIDIKKQIPQLTDLQWEKIKDKVYKKLETGASLQIVIELIKQFLIASDMLLKKKK